MAFLTQPEIDSIATAVRAAEARTSGEIVTVIARNSGTHLWPSLFAAALAGFLLPGTLVPFFGIVSSGDLFFIQIVAVLIFDIVLSIPRVRFALIPASTQRAAAHRCAREQYYERGLHLTEQRTGVLIFVSVAEHYVEILADRGIDEKVDATEWQGIVDRFVAEVRRKRIAEGFRTAVQSVGEILAQHFPSKTKNPNELPDRLFVI